MDVLLVGSHIRQPVPPALVLISFPNMSTSPTIQYPTAATTAVQLHVAWVAEDRTLSAGSIHPVLVQAYALRLSPPYPLSLGVSVHLSAVYPAAYHTPHLAVSTKSLSAYDTHITGPIVGMYSPWDGIQLCVINNSVLEHPVQYAYLLYPARHIQSYSSPNDGGPPEWLHPVATRIQPLLSEKDGVVVMNNTGNGGHYPTFVFPNPWSVHPGSIVPGIRCGPETRGAKLGCSIKRARLARK